MNYKKAFLILTLTTAGITKPSATTLFGLLGVGAGEIVYHSNITPFSTLTFVAIGKSTGTAILDVLRPPVSTARGIVIANRTFALGAIGYMTAMSKLDAYLESYLEK